MQTPVDVGVDVAKQDVVAADAGASFDPRTIANRRSELRAWLKTLPPGSRIAVEATGGYHVLLADLAHDLGLTVYVLNPKDVRHYAKGLGRRGKTDRVDAQVIARYLAKEYDALHPYVPPTPQQRQLDQLLRRRAHLVTLRTALRASAADMTVARAEIAAAVASLERLIDKLDQHRDRLMAACPIRKESYRRMQTIVSVGPVVGAGLAQILQRIPFKNADAFVAYTGLDPRPADSGKKIGRRRLSKRGPSELRRLLFNAAMSAARTKVWNPFYQRYRAAGLSSTAALVALARKIARVAWSLNRYQTDFNPALIAA
jgi:transposase